MPNGPLFHFYNLPLKNKWLPLSMKEASFSRMKIEIWPRKEGKTIRERYEFIFMFYFMLLLRLIHHRLTLDLWFAKDNRFLNPKSSYKRILMAPPCRLIHSFSFLFFFAYFVLQFLPLQISKENGTKWVLLWLCSSLLQWKREKRNEQSKQKHEFPL